MPVARVPLNQKDGDSAFKLAAFAVIFLLSLFASTLPTVSRRFSFLSIPQLAFFILKHFGTGVILSTAFVHLLQDAFDTLLALPKESPLRHWVGLLVLASLLAIFVIEYVSITYVERLEGVEDSHAHTHFSEDLSHHDPPPDLHSERQHGSCKLPHIQQQNQNGHAHLPALAEVDDDDPASEPVTERTSLLRTASTPAGREHPHATNGAAGSYIIPSVQTSAAGAAVPVFFSGHHRFEQPSAHAYHSAPSARVIARRSPALSAGLRPPGVGIPGVSEYFSGLYRSPNVQGHEDSHSHHHEDEFSGTAEACENGNGYGQEEVCAVDSEGGLDIGKKRQLINTLVLQIGIMVHSLVIGLTLSIKSGPEFTSLVVAILFHQLFEGLSLGVRIASLAASAAAGYAQACVLAALFAAAVPLGGLIGRLTLTHSSSTEALQLTQGLMSALSAGTLIYAATVELLAADFVSDPQLKRGTVRRQVLALASLLTGVCTMAALA